MGTADRKKREKENKKNTLLKVARKLFLTKGLRSVTIEEIARKAEISKGAIYLLFHSKEEIYTQILLNDVEKFHQKVSALIQHEQTASDALVRFAEFYVDFFLQDRELFRILITYMLHTEVMKLSEDMDRKLVSATNRTVNIIEDILNYGISSGEFHSRIDVRTCRNVIWGLLNGIIALHLFTGKESKREEKIRNTVRVGLESILNALRTGSNAAQ
ncbi:MAG: TetR/AcrR family transcriptional regulator [Syntrophales bacterium]|nr:TetR/AcrR family transcriptional regulator [Syntrophales bacterium]